MVVGTATSAVAASRKEKAAKKAAAQQAGATALSQATQNRILDDAEPSRQAGERALLRLEDFSKRDDRDLVKETADRRLRDLFSALGTSGNARSGVAAELGARVVGETQNEFTAQKLSADQTIAQLGGRAGSLAAGQGAGLQNTVQQGFDNLSDITLGRGAIAGELGQGILDAATPALADLDDISFGDGDGGDLGDSRIDQNAPFNT